MITPAATINVTITRTGNHIFRLVGLLTGMCSKFFSMSYIYNIKKTTKINKLLRIHSLDGQNFESDINQPEKIGILVKIIRYMVSSFSLHPIKVHAQHCHSTFSDMDAKACA